MSNFKVGNSKFTRFVNGKGFYIALAICLVAIGTAAYIAVNNSIGVLDNVKSGNKASSQNITSSIPNWDDNNSAQQTEKTVVGVPASTSSSSSSSSSASSATERSSKTTKLVYTMPVNGSVATPFSGDKLTYDKTMGDWRTHNGVDLAAAEGTPVKACASGKVVEVKTDDLFGQEIVIDHGNGIKSIYANLTSQVNVKKGQAVNVGDVIGAVGETAEAEIAITPHLHFEIQKNGKNVDPLAIISGQA
ncbi:peptidase M23 [[Clostridium] cellulosi]|jgi:Peptidase family M23.|uniref:Peptidase M23 n=1 Tax=[Clostridium] cellulosi TaxID=29343 RepID=A0A078KJ72_9FIRM|nr:peptidase M23 [[Clostridium] cellulosi]